MEDEEVIICRCEEVKKKEILKAIKMGAKDLDGIKRITRAGMGLCQGKTCSVLIRNILNEKLKIDKKNLPPVTTRPPIRLIPSKAFINDD